MKASAAGVPESTASSQEAGRGSTPTAALHSLLVKPIPAVVAKPIVEHYHYLHSFPAGTKLTFGVFYQTRLLGAMTLGVGPTHAHSLVRQAIPADCMTLTRLWLADELPKNSETFVMGIVLRALRKYSDLKFILSYADPSRGHLGIIYQASGWLYTGLSHAMPLYDIGDGVSRHSRSLSHAFGSHSIKHFAKHGVKVKLVSQSAKHRYIYFLARDWQTRLKVPILPYPKKEEEKDGNC